MDNKLKEKLSFYSILALVILLSACGNGETKTEHYVDQQGGFELDYPAQWEIEPDTKAVRFRAKNDEATFYIASEPAAQWAGLLVPSNVPLDIGHFQHNLKVYWSEDSTGFSLGEPETTQLSGHEAIRFVIQGKKLGVLGHYGWLIISMSGDNVYMITSTAQNQSTWGNYESTFMTMLDSIRIPAKTQ